MMTLDDFDRVVIVVSIVHLNLFDNLMIEMLKESDLPVLGFTTYGLRDYLL